MKNKFLFIFIIIFMINSCSGFKLKRSERSDEFLIEKKKSFSNATRYKRPS